MSNSDYEAGLRGAWNITRTGEALSDWEAGHRQYLANKDLSDRMRDSQEQADDAYEQRRRELEEREDEAAEARLEAIRIAQEAAEAADQRAAEAIQAADVRAERLLQTQRDIAANAWRASAESMCDRAQELLAANLLDEALTLCRQGLTSDPGSFRLQLVLALVHYRRGTLDLFDLQVGKLASMIAGQVSGASFEHLLTDPLFADALPRAAPTLRALAVQEFKKLGEDTHKQKARTFVIKMRDLGWTSEIASLVCDGTAPPCAVSRVLSDNTSRPLPTWALQIARHWAAFYANNDNVRALPWEDRIILLCRLYEMLSRGADINVSDAEARVCASLSHENALSSYLRDAIEHGAPLTRYRLSLLAAAALVRETAIEAPSSTIPASEIPRTFAIADHLDTIAGWALGGGGVVFVAIGLLSGHWMMFALLSAAAAIAGLTVAVLDRRHGSLRAKRLALEWMRTTARLQKLINDAALTHYVEVYGTVPSEDGAPELRIRADAARAADALLESRRLDARPDFEAHEPVLSFV